MSYFKGKNMPWEQQSPVNLAPTVRAVAPKDYLRLAWNSAVQGFRRVGDHGVEIIFPLSDTTYLELEGKKYHLRQFHFHHPSEHLLEGQQFDAELHIVHQDLSDATISVIGVFLSVEENGTSNRETALLEKAFLSALETSEAIPLKPVWWLPRPSDRLLRYEGSLTTPPFSETVSWAVFREPKVIPPGLFGAIFGKHPQSARGIQGLGRRFILDLDVRPVISK